MQHGLHVVVPGGVRVFGGQSIIDGDDESIDVERVVLAAVVLAVQITKDEGTTVDEKESATRSWEIIAGVHPDGDIASARTRRDGVAPSDSLVSGGARFEERVAKRVSESARSDDVVHICRRGSAEEGEEFGVECHARNVVVRDVPITVETYQ